MPHTHRNPVSCRSAVLILLALLSLPVSAGDRMSTAEEIFAYLRQLGNGSYMFGQMATWVHDENPDMDHATNWLKKVSDHTGKMPQYGCVTYDFHDNPFPDAAWNRGVKTMWDRGMIVGVYSFYANPSGKAWNDPLDIDPIFAPGNNPTKRHFYGQMDRMAANLQWLKDQGIPVVYTPFVESDDRNKWHAKEGSEHAIKLYRLVHDYFENTKHLDNLIWAYHTTQNHGALETYYPGDAYVDILGKSAYGTGLPFSEYAWAVEKKRSAGKVIWWAELGIRGRSERPRDCMDVVKKLENNYPELAGFVFWSDNGHYNVIGNENGPELMACPEIITLGTEQSVTEAQILTRATAIHERALTLDSHVDIPNDAYATTELDPGIDHPRLKCDLVKMTRGGLDAVFLAVYVGQRPQLNEQGFERVQEIALKKFAAIRRLTETMHPDRCTQARSADDVDRIVTAGKKAIIIGMENGYPIGEDLTLLDRFYELGTRYITLCHIGNNQICDSSSTKTPLHSGLSDFGKQAVIRMNQLGIMADASHISVQSFYDLLKVSRAPIIASHSGCHALCEHDRNLTDEQLRALSKNGGVIQIVALGQYLKAESPERALAMDALREELGIPNWEERSQMTDAQRAAIKPKIEAYYKRRRVIAERLPVATLTDYVNHIDHAVKIAGIDHVGIGTDFDGGGGIPGFNDHAELLNVTVELVRRGYTEKDIQKILGGNFMRVWRQVEAFAKNQQLTTKNE